MAEVVIVGGGPAGLNCAYHLAKGGKEVVVLEKHPFPVGKLCAGGLTLKDFKEGVPKEIVERSFSTHTIHTPSGQTTLKAKEPIVFTADRKKISQWLFEWARRAGAIIERKRVTRIEDRAVITKDGKKINYHYLIGADGSLSLVRRYLNVPTINLVIAWQTSLPFSVSKMQWFMNPKLFGQGYGWIFPHRDKTMIGFGCSNLKDIPKTKKKFLFWIKERCGLKINTTFKAHPINSDYRGHQFGHIYLIGDAGGFASGLTWEGIYFALVSGREVARMILNKNYETRDLRALLSLKRRHERMARMLHLPRPILTHLFECLRRALGISFLSQLIIKKYG